MARHEPSRQPVPTQPLTGPVHVRVRRDAKGRVEIVTPERPVNATVEAAERPTHADDPRGGPFRNIPPFGGA